MANNDINLKDEDTQREYKELNFRYSEAKKLFDKFEQLAKSTKKENQKELFNILKDIISFVEVNPVYNYYFLKYHKNIKDYLSFNEMTGDNEIFTFEENFEQLKGTLKEINYYELTGKKQANPALEVYELINLFINKNDEFYDKSKKICYQQLNCPLIESIERTRMLYYKSLFKYPDENDKKKQSQFNGLCKGINHFRCIIKYMKNWFESINLDEESLNKKFFVFIIYLTMIDNFKFKEYTSIKKIFEKEFNPNKEYKNIKKKLNNKENGLIEELIENESEDEEDYIISKIEILNDKQFKIFNKFESFILDRSNYVLENLIAEIRDFNDYPIECLLERNQTITSFFNNNKNIINDEELFPDFKKYFKYFIKSKVVEEALNSSGKHGNIIKLLKSNFIDEILNEKYIISLPFYNKALEGFTNKDFMISGISGLPFIISSYGKIKSKEEYNNLKNVLVIINIAIKLLVCLHEILIHLAYGYLFHISDGEILPESPKSNKIYYYSNSPADDGGSYFEELLFGQKWYKISFNQAIRLLNGNLSNLEEFRKELNEPIDLKDGEKQGVFLKKILNKYIVEITLLKNENVNGIIRGMNQEIAYTRENYYIDCQKI